MSDTADWRVTWRDIIVPLLCPRWGARTAVFGKDAGNLRPQRLLITHDGVAHRVCRDSPKPNC